MSGPPAAALLAGPALGARPARSWRLLVIVGAGLAGAAVGVEPLLGILAAIVVFLGVVVMAKPDWATIVAVAVLYSNAAVVAHRVHGLPRPVAQAAALLVAVALVHHLGVRRRPFVLAPAAPWIAALLVVQLVGAARATEPAFALEAVQDFLTGGVFLYLAFTNAIRTYDVLRSVVWTLLLVGALLGAIGLYQSSTKTFDSDYGGFAQVDERALERRELVPDEEAPDPRLGGPIGEKNFYAQVMFVLVPVGFMVAVGASRWFVRLLAFGFTGLIAIGGALTVSRGGAVGLALALLVLVGMRFVPVRYLVAAMIGLGLLLSFLPRYAERLGEIGAVSEIIADDGATGDVDSAVMGRLGANVAALRVFAEHPILGVGSGMFNTYYREEAKEAGFLVAEGSRSAHNLYLQLAAENGLLGVVALAGAVGVTLRDLRRARARVLVEHPMLAAIAGGVFGSIVTYLTTGLFLSLAYQRYFWFLLALGAATAALVPTGSTWPSAGASSAERTPRSLPRAR